MEMRTSRLCPIVVWIDEKLVERVRILATKNPRFDKSTSCLKYFLDKNKCLILHFVKSSQKKFWLCLRVLWERGDFAKLLYFSKLNKKNLTTINWILKKSVQTCPTKIFFKILTKEKTYKKSKNIFFSFVKI